MKVEEKNIRSTFDESEILSIEENYLNDESMCMRSPLSELKACKESGCSTVLYDSDKIVAYNLVRIDDYGLGFVEKSFVVPSLRGNKLMFQLLQLSIEKLKNKGVTIVYLMLNPDNVYSKRNVNLCGFVKSHEVVCHGNNRIVVKKVIYESTN